MRKNFEYIKTEPEINITGIKPEDIAKQYAENLRERLRTQKEQSSDIHLEDINVDKITYQELMMYDKLLKGNLSEKEIDDYRKNVLHKYFDEQEREMGSRFDVRKDSRSNFSSMLLNKIISESLNKRKEKVA
jgi:hypothetical protein